MHVAIYPCVASDGSGYMLGTNVVYVTYRGLMVQASPSHLYHRLPACAPSVRVEPLTKVPLLNPRLLSRNFFCAYLLFSLRTFL